MDTPNENNGEPVSASVEGGNEAPMPGAAAAAPHAAGASEESKHDIVMGILAYLGILVIIPYLAKKDDKFVKFHIKQGLVLFAIEVIVWLISFVIWRLWPIYDIINLALFVLAIMGIINVAHGKEKELPIVGKFSEHFKI